MNLYLERIKLMFLEKEYEDKLYGKDLIQPSKDHYSKLHVYYHGFVLANITTENVGAEAIRLDQYLRNHCINTGDGLSHDFNKIRRDFKKLGVTTEVEVDAEAFNRDRGEYRITIGERIDIFKRDLYEYYGVTDHPKADAVYDKAYDRFHSCGFNEVSNAFGYLVDLIR